jgi:uncharacterized protein YuzE
MPLIGFSTGALAKGDFLAALVISEGIVLDYDATGRLVGIDIDNASKKVQLQQLVVNKFPAAVETATS